MIIALQTLIYYRQSLLAAIDRALKPYYRRLSLAFLGNAEDSEEEDADDQVFSEFDDEKGVIFFPPVYAQRYASVSDCLMDERWRGKLEKVVDIGYHDLSFIKYLKEVPGVCQILGVDIESLPLKCSSDVLDDYNSRRESPLQITLFQGNAADPDYRLIGCDAVIAIEMIEHMLPHDLERLVHTVFGFIKPWIAVFTTPNGDFNVLFKALEKNGLRRLDHFFEWSREQFNDWCSNIVTRYPIYTVTCKGIGPGPPGTLHYGCCSQLALFINKDYHKQPDLNINSLALVPRHNPEPLNDLYDCWDSTDSLHDMEPIEAPNGMASFTEFLHTDNQSQVTFVVSPNLSTSLPIYALCSEEKIYSNSDKTSQCNLDTEIAKNFLMFDEEQYFDVRVPRRRITNRVYEFEDVTSRLNCSTFQVKKFSKTAQNLMAKNKNDSLVHTREVVDEIRNLTKALKFNKCIANLSDDTNIWSNINWGDNAPYWNEYYKVVREFHCPFEAKSEECRILDLISDEINRIIDTQFEDDLSCDTNRVEIPLNHLMTVVQHITEDVGQVRDILEWNGYEIVNDVVIYSRLVVGTTSVTTHDDEWQDNDSLSDLDNLTDVQSTTVSEGSMFAPDYHDQRVHRALDQKVRNLRLMLTADEDITTELDKVVCKLMKIALRMSRGRNTAPPAKWMQCKLLDLLTLTEKAIERRKKYSIEDSLKAIEFNVIDDKLQQISNIKKAKDDRVMNEIVDKYCHIIISASDMTVNIDNPKYGYNNTEDDLLSTSSNEFLRDFNFVDSVAVPKTSSLIAIDTTKPEITERNSLERTKAFENNLEVLELDYEYNKFNDTETVTRIRREHNQLRPKTLIKKGTESTVIKASNGTSFHKYKSKKVEKKRKSNSTRVRKKLTRKKSDDSSVVKNPALKYRNNCNNYNLRPTRRPKVNRCFTVRASKPIPESLIDLCHPELKFGKDVKAFKFTNNISEIDKIVNLNESTGNLSTKNISTIDIVLDNKQKSKESIAGEEIAINSDMITNDQQQVEFDLNLCTKHHVSMESVNLQTIFLNDINEPSTSKGIRHNVSMDVQCGPDTLATYPMLSASTSLIRLPPELSAALKIHNNNSKTRAYRTEFGTSTQDGKCDSIITPRSRSVGIKIKDSDLTITATDIDIGTTIQNFLQPQERNPSVLSLCLWRPESGSDTPIRQVSFINKTHDSYDRTEVNILKPKDSFIENSNAYQKFSNDSKNCNEVLGKNHFECKENRLAINTLELKYNKPTLCCGGVFVHSYKDKQECEDIVYQGVWQRLRPKSARKKQYNSIVAKNINDTIFRGQKNILKKICDFKDKHDLKNSEQIKHNLDVKKRMQMRNFSSRKSKQGDNVIKVKSILSKTAKVIPNLTKPSRSINNVTKVVSKIGISTISSKSVKSALNAKKTQMKIPVKKDNSQKKSTTLHNRKQNTKLFDNCNVDMSIDSKVHAEMKKKELTEVPLSIYKTDEFRKDLINFNDNFIKNAYTVFCNDTQQNYENSTGGKLPSNTTFTEDDITLSPSSLNSSTCSSPNSIVTIKAMATKSKNKSHKRHSTSLHESSFNTSESDNSMPTKEKRLLKKCKSTKKCNVNQIIDNKENVPVATNLICKEISESSKSLNLGQRRSILIAQPITDRSTIQARLKKTSNKSIIKIPVPENIDERKRSSYALMSRKKSLETEIINRNMVSNQDLSYSYSAYANTVLVIKPQELILNPQNPELLIEKSLESSHLDWIQNSQSKIDPNNTNNFIKQLTEELLDDVDISNETYSTNKDTIILNSENTNVEMNESSSSFKTVNTDYLYNTFVENDMENSFDATFDKASISNLPDIRLNLLTSKSLTPVSNRSEYFLADNELDIAVSLLDESLPSNRVLNHSSIAEIFERKKHRRVQVPPGYVSAQVFSGFSLDGKAMTADQVDPISLIDSETRSMAVGVSRLAASEELLISSRSSDSYESCLADDDGVVPNWLFQVISQQQSIEDDEPFIGPQRAPIGEPIYDENGNVIVMGVVGVATGAGDGRGIHSEPSQDSSGRGTSLSSSDTSSSQLTEALASQFELLRDAASADLMTATTSQFNSITGNSSSLDNINLLAITGQSHHLRQPLVTASSDIDADISSIDTDLPDSTDN